MPYLALDLDAKKRCERIARARSLHPGVVIYALMEAWETAWRAKRATLSNLELSGCVGPDQVLVGDFCEMGFLESEGAGWRVKGADRYLRIREAQSTAGKQHAGNLRKGPMPPAPEPAGRARPESHVPVSSPALPPGIPGEDSRLLRSSSDDRRSTIEAAPSVLLKQPPPKEHLAVVVREPDTPADSWLGEDFWRWFQSRRQKAGFVAEKPPHPSGLSSWFSNAMSTVDGDVETLKSAVLAFGDDKFWQTKDPPLPWNGFASQCPPKWIPRRKERPRAEG